MAKILIIEDDVKIRTELSNLLTCYDYECILIEFFEHVIEQVLSSEADLILLDINLPYVDGYHICKGIRAASSIPIIVVTSRDSEMDELMSMNLGADDFVTKPYNIQILLARIASVLRRTQRHQELKAITYKGLTLDLSQSKASFENQEVELTKNELRILHLLMKHQTTIVSRDEIMNELWQSDEFVDDNTLTVNINRLRRKLEDVGANDYIMTKRGQGYRL